MKYETVIGLEVHVELKTETKLFCNCSTKFGSKQNNNVCAVCLGYPGTLPIVNEKVVELATRAGLALNCSIPNFNKFDRKQYYYPDIPKNFQTSQFDFPIAVGGHLEIEVNGTKKIIRITRAHIEEDAGKLIHSSDSFSKYALVDYNRGGVPLIEIVSEPDLSSADEVKAYLEKLKAILEYIGASDCKMEEGSLRCDVNISLKPVGATELGTRAELKNMNSFRSVQKGIEYEITRQTAILDEGGKIIQETRGWDEEKGITLGLRNKEQAHDYRYFPEPDLPPIILDQEWIDNIKNNLPELPDAKKARFINELGLSEYDASVIITNKDFADYYDEVVNENTSPKLAANWVMGDLTKNLNAENIDITECKIKPAQLANLIKLIDKGTISGKIAKTVFDEMFETGKDPESIVKEKGLVQISDESSIVSIIEEVIAENPKSVEDFKSGKAQAIGFLVGQVMRKTKGQANPEIVNKLLKEKLQ